MNKRLLREMFGVGEATDPRQAERELNMGTSVARPPRGHTPATAKMQADVDSAQSLVRRKNEAAGSATGLRVSGDKATMGALMDALHEAASAAGFGDNPDMEEWCDKAMKACASGVKTGTATLPPFIETPGLDDFNDDEGPGPEEDY